MVLSMTGYGSATKSSDNYKVTVELKSLNSKYLELVIKLPRIYVKYEHKVRNLLTRKLGRGKVVFLLNVEVLNAGKRTLNINKALVGKYLDELRDLSEFIGSKETVSLTTLLDLPEVIPTEMEQEDPEEWSLIEEAVKEAADKLTESRGEEGKALDNDLESSITSLESHLATVQELAPTRLANVRKRIDQSLEEIRHKVEVDPNRFEQELIFYVEKLDINEEIVRLKQHLKYFETIRKAPKSNGKQMQFLSQEMGREINTIGSKANDALIQREVVQMKDQLDKIKEQVLNVL